MQKKENQQQKMMKKLLKQYKRSKFRRKFKQFFFTILWAYICYWWGMVLYEWGFEMNYYAYLAIIMGLLALHYGIKWIYLMVAWAALKEHLVLNGIKVEAKIVNVEYIDSWSTYQKGTFIFAVPNEWLLEGMNLIFKSERLFLKFPKSVVRPWDVVSVFVDPKNLQSYWMNIESIFSKRLS